MSSSPIAPESGLVLLHLSDLHFGNKNRFQGRDLAVFGQQFSQAVDLAREELGWKRRVDLVVVSGDIAEVARPKEFEDGRVFLTAMIQGLELRPHRTLFVPGNHDFSWALCEKVDADRKIEEFDDAEYAKRLNEVKFKFYDEFLEKFYGSAPDILSGYTLLDANSGACLFDLTIDDRPVSFAALNTSELETHKRYGGALGRGQAEALMRTWSTAKYEGSLKIIIVHHNPLATPIPNIKWSETWYTQQIKRHKQKVDDEWLRHYTADMIGFEGVDWLRSIVSDTWAHLVLHGHHHSPNEPGLMRRRSGGYAPVLSVGSFGLKADLIPTEQPLTCQLLSFQIAPEPRLVAEPLEFDPNYRPNNALDPGQFRHNHKAEARYNEPFAVPSGWKPSAPEEANKNLMPETKVSPELQKFVDYYRNRLVGLYSSYDLKNLGVLPTEVHKAENPQLDDLYLPLRFDEKFDINKTDQGFELDVEAILNRLTVNEVDLSDQPMRVISAEQLEQLGQKYRNVSLAITGAAGTGKTTWMRYTFRRMRDDARTLPFLVELRSVAKFWHDHNQQRDKGSIEAYLGNWVQLQAPAFEGSGIKFDDLLNASAEWLPVLLVDGWDELGDLGIQFREQLLGLMAQYPRLLVIASSRPYGSARPSSSDGFVQIQVQPLNPQEISTFAVTFYAKCYREDSVQAWKQAEEFGTALERSTDAQILARTPLLLTMMLFINRSKRLPDKRHQLYEECLRSLLSERPEMQMDEGARFSPGEWCPSDDGLARLQIVAQMAYDLQNDHSGSQDEFASATPIVVSKETLKEYLPFEWDTRKRDGFLLWLCSRAGIMVDNTEDNIWFAHLSFQEFLTAWHLNNNQVGEIALEHFQYLAEQAVWWETLLLWAALLNDQSKVRASELLQGLLAMKSIILVGMMLADGVGNEVQMSTWAVAFSNLLCQEWTEQIERCLRAWQASRQEERKAILVSKLRQTASGAPWMGYLRLVQMLEGIGSLEPVLVNDSESPLQSPISVLYQPREVIIRVGSAKQFAGARALSGISAFWPGYPEGLLHLWPSERRRLTLDLQRLVSINRDRETLIRFLAREQAYRERLRNHYASHSVALSTHRANIYDVGADHTGLLARDLASDSVVGDTVDYNLDFAHDFADKIARYFDRDIAQDLARYYDYYFDHDFGLELHSFLSFNFTNGLPIDGIYSPTDPVDPDHARQHARARYISRYHDRDGDLYKMAAGMLEGAKLFCSLCCLQFKDPQQLPEYLSLLHMFTCATRTSIGCQAVSEELTQSITLEEQRGPDPLWISLARHVARISTSEDRTLLEDLAAHPEKRESPLSWGLKYIVRGDVLLPDGTHVTLDELCDEAGVERYPLLEEMPSELEQPDVS